MSNDPMSQLDDAGLFERLGEGDRRMFIIPGTAVDLDFKAATR